MDAELESCGAAYRSLGMGFYMENLLRPLPQMTSEGVLSLPLNPDRPLATIATQDIAAIAARLLLDRTWEGTDRIPVFGDNLTPNEMAATISDVLGLQVTFEQADLEQVTASTIERGVPEGMARDFTAMYWAQQNGIYDEDWSYATPTPTNFRTWCETVLAPAAEMTSWTTMDENQAKAHTPTVHCIPTSSDWSNYLSVISVRRCPVTFLPPAGGSICSDAGPSVHSSKQFESLRLP